MTSPALDENVRGQRDSGGDGEDVHGAHNSNLPPNTLMGKRWIGRLLCRGFWCWLFLLSHAHVVLHGAAVVETPRAAVEHHVRRQASRVEEHADAVLLAEFGRNGLWAQSMSPCRAISNRGSAQNGGHSFGTTPPGRDDDCGGAIGRWSRSPDSAAAKLAYHPDKRMFRLRPSVRVVVLAAPWSAPSWDTFHDASDVLSVCCTGRF